MSLLSDLFKKKKTAQVSEISQLFKQNKTNIVNKQKQQVLPATTPKIQNQQQQQQHVEETEQQKKQELARTVFIGNVHIQAKRKQIKNLFQKFGVIQKVWFRSIPVQQTKMGPKASYILKKFQENAESMNCYIRFSNVQSATRAKQMNGQKYKQLNLRVTLADQKQLDFQSTIFIGNLPFQLKEQELRDFFASAGNIENIRIIRNSINHLGIGIAYIKFSNKQQMVNAIKNFNNKEFMGRNIRVKKSVQKKKLEKKKLKKEKLKNEKMNKNAEFAKRRMNQKIINKNKSQNQIQNQNQNQNQFRNQNQNQYQKQNQNEKSNQKQKIFQQKTVQGPVKKIKKANKINKKQKKFDPEQQKLKKDVAQQIKLLNFNKKST